MDRAQLRERIVRDGLVKASPTGPMIYNRQGAQDKWFMDLRPLLLRADTLEAVVRMMHRQMPLGPFFVGGIETTSIILVSAFVATVAGVSGFYVRKQRKHDGLRKWIEGNIRGADAGIGPVWMVDDILNSGTRMRQAIEVVHDHGVRVDGVITVIGYGQLRDPEWWSSTVKYRKCLFDISEFPERLD